MAFNPAPSSFFGAGYTLASSEIKLTTNDNAGTKLLTEVTDTEAHATTGDWRKVVFGLMEALYGKYNALASADRPAKLTISRSSYEDAATGELVRTYTVTARTQALAQEVSSE